MRPVVRERSGGVVSTNISWCDETWNPTTGCSRVSEGCRNCYAAKLAPRLAGMGQKGYTKLPWTAKNAPENVFLHPDRLDKPFKWKKPRRVFVNSMSDLFHEQVPDDFIEQVFSVMALADRHTFQVLTKRPERMARLLADDGFAEAVTYVEGDEGYGHLPWPLPNVWLGTSVEDQRAADERIPHLLRTPAAVRFLSCEPLIGEVWIDRYLWFSGPSTAGPWKDALGRHRGGGGIGGQMMSARESGDIGWVIAGGESGPGFRPMDPDWPRSLRDQCVAAGVPFFFKQWGGSRSEGEALLDGEEWRQFPLEEVKHG